MEQSPDELESSVLDLSALGLGDVPDLPSDERLGALRLVLDELEGPEEAHAGFSSAI